MHGIGPGSTLDEVDRAIDCASFDDVDASGLSMRRDYGFVEFSFNATPTAWVMASATLELHRLAWGRELAEKWREGTGVDFPRYLSWSDLWEALSQVPEATCLKDVDQGGFFEHRFRARAAHVTVIVNDDGQRRGRQLGQGDVWSVSAWAAESE
ncbi:hypothetical protein [Streptomyces sp. NPDC000410]|uniref:hypothetical protein n=1 Tax=Streptomyces sp. NPDC000410 TaxID=3154254 RepID=UPI00331ED821